MFWKILLTFDYKGDLLTKIVSKTGEYVDYQYDGDRLQKISYSQGRVLDISYHIHQDAGVDENGDDVDGVFVKGKEQIATIIDRENCIGDEFVLDDAGNVKGINFKITGQENKPHHFFICICVCIMLNFLFCMFVL